VELLVVLPGVTLLLCSKRSQERTTSIARPNEWWTSFAFVSIVIVVYVTVALVGSWRQEDPWHDLRELALPVWLPLCLLPCIYALSLYSGYQVAFLRIDLFAKGRPGARRRAKAALLVNLNVRTHLVAKFGGGWLTQIAEAQTLSEARAVVRRYRTANPAGLAQRNEPEIESFEGEGPLSLLSSTAPPVPTSVLGTVAGDPNRVPGLPKFGRMSGKFP
jgi:hypothetical protein